MNPTKVTQMMKIALLLVCLLFHQTIAISISKDILLLSFLAKILKPRFVPLPIPIPLPIKFTKTSHKGYPVPLHGHSLASHQVDHLPLSYGLTGPSYGHGALSHGLSGPSYGHSALSHALSGPSYGHSALSHGLSGSSYGSSTLSHGLSGSSYGSSALSHGLSGSSYGLSGSSYDSLSYGESVSSHSLDAAELKEIEKLLAVLDLKEKLKSSAQHDLSSLSDISDSYESTNEILSKPHIESLSGSKLYDDSDVLYKSSSSQLDSVHDDIEAIGGLDTLTDLDNIGSSKKWW